MAEYVRTGQWEIMHSTYDRWGPFCEAAARYEQKLQANVQVILPKLHAVAVNAAVSKRMRRRKAPVATLIQVLQNDVQVEDPLSAPAAVFFF